METDVVRFNGVSVVSGVEFRENVRAFFPQGQSELSVRTGCSNKVGVRKAGFRSTADWAIS